MPAPGRPSSRRPRRARAAVASMLAVAALAPVVAACDGDSAASASGDEIVVATTVAPITSIAANIGGDRVAIAGIVPEGTNSHTFEPKPSVAELLSRADVVYTNGLELEEPTKELAEQVMGGDEDIVELGTQAIPEDQHIYDFSFPKSGGKPNPHLWTDPKYALSYAQTIRDDLSERDPGNADYYAANYEEFAAMVKEFDTAMRASFATIPAADRKLLTYHDAYAYFAEDYAWTIIGAIQVENFEDPTPKEVAGLIDQVEEEGVPAIFGSEVFPSPVLEQIGREAGVKYVDVLRDDDLPGAPGDPEHSWVGLMHFDYITMTESLGGDASALKAFTPRDVAPDTGEYPQ
ncbi:MAG TPA: metal ABC transporter substrate-binding protein [Miltoncostaeaceae bacterium]|nr:metal ABC transporter substrate-binding protein [Miltoncostaeaceae bacterium]